MTSSGSSKSEFGRFVTWLPNVTNQRIALERLPVEIDPRLGESSGPWVEKYCSYIRMLAKMKFSIVITSWDDVVEVEKNLLW